MATPATDEHAEVRAALRRMRAEMNTKAPTLRLEDKPRAEPLEWLSNRLFEWMTTAMMLGIACALALTPDTLSMGAFRYMLAAGLTPAILGAFFTFVGLMRIIALYLNGHWEPWGPWCRAFGALGGALIWGQMMVALVILTRDTGTFSMGIPVYFFLVLGELLSSYRAIANAGTPNH